MRKLSLPRQRVTAMIWLLLLAVQFTPLLSAAHHLAIDTTSLANEHCHQTAVEEGAAANYEHHSLKTDSSCPNLDCCEVGLDRTAGSINSIEPLKSFSTVVVVCVGNTEDKLVALHTSAPLSRGPPRNPA